MKVNSFRDNVLHLGRGAVVLGLCMMVGGVGFDSPATVAIGCVVLFGAAYALIFAKTGSY